MKSRSVGFWVATAPALWAAVALSPRASAQAAMGLQITSPAEDTVVHPGERVTVAVSVPANVRLRAVALGGDFPLPNDLGRLIPPWQLTFLVPGAASSAGRYYIFALGLLGLGRGVKSRWVWLDLEPSEPPSALKVSNSLLFERVGEDLPLSVTACFSHAPPMDVTKSTRITYTSSDKSVVVVNSTGYATSTGRGSAVVVIKFGGKTVIVPVSVE